MGEFPDSQAAEPRYRRLTGSDLERIAERHVAGESDAQIAKIVGCDRSSVRRARSRPSVVAQVGMLRARQRRAQAERDRRVRAKMRKLCGVRTDTPLRPEDVAAVPTPAGRGGGAKRGRDDPREDIGDEWGFGPPGFDRPPLGYIPPDQRLVRLLVPPGISAAYNRGSTTHVVPVLARDVDELLAAGATRV